MTAREDDFHAELANALRERNRIIADHALRDRDPAAHLAALQQVSETIANLTARLPRDADPRLRHFLEKASYSKALEFLQTG